MTSYIACPHCGQTHECQRAPAITPGICGNTIVNGLGAAAMCNLLLGHFGAHSDGAAHWSAT